MPVRILLQEVLGLGVPWNGQQGDERPPHGSGRETLPPATSDSPQSEEPVSTAEVKCVKKPPWFESGLIQPTSRKKLAVKREMHQRGGTVKGRFCEFCEHYGPVLLKYKQPDGPRAPMCTYVSEGRPCTEVAMYRRGPQGSLNDPVAEWRCQRHCVKHAAPQANHQFAGDTWIDAYDVDVLDYFLFPFHNLSDPKRSAMRKVHAPPPEL